MRCLREIVIFSNKIDPKIIQSKNNINTRVKTLLKDARHR